MTKLNINYSVSELIAALEKLPGDLPILTSGYEGGFENVLKPEVCHLQHVKNSPWYDGEFEGVDQPGDCSSFPAVVLKRAVRSK